MFDYNKPLDLSWLPHHEYVVWDTTHCAWFWKYDKGRCKYTSVFAKAGRFRVAPPPHLNEIVLGVVEYPVQRRGR